MPSFAAPRKNDSILRARRPNEITQREEAIRRLDSILFPPEAFGSWDEEIQKCFQQATSFSEKVSLAEEGYRKIVERAKKASEEETRRWNEVLDIRRQQGIEALRTLESRALALQQKVSTRFAHVEQRVNESHMEQRVNECQVAGHAAKAAPSQPACQAIIPASHTTQPSGLNGSQLQGQLASTTPSLVWTPRGNPATRARMTRSASCDERGDRLRIRPFMFRAAPPPSTR
eukprot:GEMP01078819.1.p1 GENE.GEMP01078819.1~~GEMP01078819.1.p1  ORF type:complete len:231 (+),score=59.15 GEMP01078819.1:106-798(+)